MVENLLPILRDRYPEFFSHAPLREIACLPGWLDLIDELCRTLKTHMDTHPELPPIQVRRLRKNSGGCGFTILVVIRRAESWSLAQKRDRCRSARFVGKLGLWEGNVGSAYDASITSTGHPQATAHELTESTLLNP